jgi:hypothetical protein
MIPELLGTGISALLIESEADLESPNPAWAGFVQ